MKILGIDIGGSGIKGAIVETKTGELLSDRIRISTPQPPTPTNIKETIRTLVNHFEWKGLVGCSFPAVVIDGKCFTFGNLSPKWVGVQTDKLFSEACDGIPFFVANDADLAGLAEVDLGIGKGLKGKVIMLTIGTGIGSGIFYNGKLIPNFELGRMFHTDGEVAEKFSSDAARKRDDLSLKEWAARFDIFLKDVYRVTTPEYIILGGGASKKFEKFKDILSLDIPVMPAHFRNNAGIIGAAIYAQQMHAKVKKK